MSDKDTNILFNREKIEQMEKQHKEDFDELKKYVSDGKAMLANTITSKGVALASSPVPEFSVINQKILELCNKIENDTKKGSASIYQVLSGYTFTSAVAGIEASGAMPNCSGWNGTVTFTDSSVTIPAGYHDGNGTVSLVKSGGTDSATADDILYQKTATVNGTQVTGSMTNQGNWGTTVYVTQDPKSKSVTIPAGYHAGSGVVSINTDAEVNAVRTEAYKDGVKAGVASMPESIKITNPHAYYSSGNHTDERFIITVPDGATQIKLSSGDANAGLELWACNSSGTKSGTKALASGKKSIIADKLSGVSYALGQFTSDSSQNAGLTAEVFIR